MRECWIIGGGHGGIAENTAIADDALIIAADSGITLAGKLGIVPHIIVGDFDSYKGEIPDNAAVVKLPVRKDDTDMMYAVKKALEQGCKKITLCGALGGRLDHTFANIQTLEFIEENGGQGRIVSDDNIVMLQSAGTVSYEKKDGWYFSVFSITETSVVSLKGTEYTLDSYELKRSFPLGVSNEITAENAEVTVHSGKLLVMYSKK